MYFGLEGGGGGGGGDSLLCMFVGMGNIVASGGRPVCMDPSDHYDYVHHSIFVVSAYQQASTGAINQRTSLPW